MKEKNQHTTTESDILKKYIVQYFMHVVDP